MAALFTTIMERAGADAQPSGDGREDAAPLTAQMSLAGGPDPDLTVCLGRMHQAARDVLRAKTGAKVGWAIAAQAFTPTPGNEAVWQQVFDSWEGRLLDLVRG